ncbi:hypothetical protein [Pectobacterium versatile]|uniref:hypothetical protein n=2 Tax=Pectobacterium versatile TaxID=2488639 RepID=UPI001B391F36|nr:hypothetical protein [Pectobacterium versatile]MCA5950648.1 hypothetical protein [Pectobacterium versatile]
MKAYKKQGKKMREAKTVNMAINKIVRKHFRKQTYRVTNSYELHQFASLFNTDYLSKLAQLLFRSDSHASDNLYTYYYAVDVGWIDKKPLAEYAAQTSFKGVELGDALILYNNHLIDRSGKHLCLLNERAVIIQAKITNNKARIPKVTVTSGGSSNKEYALYSRWPTFRLKSNTKHFNLPTLTHLNNPYPYTYYLAARKSYSKHSNWPCHWMGAPSILSNRCNISAGEILLSLKSGVFVNNYQVGAELNSNKEWARLVRSVLMKVCLGWTNTGWCGRIMPTRMKGDFLQYMTKQLPTLITTKYYSNFYSSRIKFTQINSCKYRNNLVSNENLIPDFSGKFMVLRITRISSEFHPESEKLFKE